MLKLGIIGTGYHARTAHLPALVRYAEERPGTVSLAAVCDMDPTAAGKAAEQWHACRAFASVDELLGQAELDAVLALTPHELNAATAAARRHSSTTPRSILSTRSVSLSNRSRRMRSARIPPAEARPLTSG